MFASIERKLAILNVSVVVAIVAVIGVGIWFTLGRSLENEANASLESRIQSTRNSLNNLPSLSTGNRSDNAGMGQQRAGRSDDEDDENESDSTDESHDIVVSGDTLVYVFDTDGNLVTNRRNVTLNGIPNADAVDRALDGTQDTRIVTVDGERIRIRTEPVNYDGRVVGAIQAVRSEAEHDAELALVRNVSLLGMGLGVLIAVPVGILLTRRAMLPINDVMHRQQTFVADAAHELRTPLTVLRANTEVIQRSPELSREELNQELASMVGDIDGMSNLVNELLQLSQVDDDGYAVDRTPIALLPEIQRVVEMLTSQANLAGVTLGVAGQDVFINSNANLMNQALRIVLENAIKYTPAGGSVEVASTRDHNRVIVTVRDTGIGIGPQDLPYVFDRFYRADKARTRSSGTGLGLPIAQRIMTLVDGTITITSVPGEGTTVTLVFPIAAM